MDPVIAVVNTGSSSLKLAAFELVGGALRERTRLNRDLAVSAGDLETHLQDDLASFARALAASPSAVAHRVVHGGRETKSPVELTPDVELLIEALTPLAPLHQPASLAGIRAARQVFPRARQLAFFDTAFHAARSPASLAVPLPGELQSFGFHGLAHESLLEQTALAVGRAPEQSSAVTLQLGHGCSACAIRNGRSIETSMGFSPLGGLTMPARSGDLDPGVLVHLLRGGLGAAELERLLYERSGLFALTGSADVRAIEKRAAAGDERARLGLEVFARAIVTTVGAYFTLLEGDGALVFGGGIGTGSAEVRSRVCAGLRAWNVHLDPSRNAAGASGTIHRPGSRPVFCFTTDEEGWMARALLTSSVVERGP
jgi:acetate kinase